MVVVLAVTNDMCIIRNPITLKANAKFNTEEVNHMMIRIKRNRWKMCRKWTITLPKARKVVARVPGVSGISPSLKNTMKFGSNDKVTRVVSRKV